MVQPRVRPPMKRAATIEDADEIASRDRLLADLFEAVNNDEADEVEELIEAGAEVNSADGSGRTALMRATAAGVAEVVERLIKLGADTSPRDVGGWTALIWACELSLIHI